MKFKLVTFVILLTFFTSNDLQAQEPYLGEIRMFAGNFAPRGWAFCDGQMLSIAQNSALFSLLGTMYGGDGRTTFALPDLRGRAPIHAGNGPGLQSIRIGDKGGQEGHYLMELNVPSSASKQTMVVRVPVNRTGDQLNIRDPYLAVNYIIALQGIYPSRN